MRGRRERKRRKEAKAGRVPFYCSLTTSHDFSTATAPEAPSLLKTQAIATVFDRSTPLVCTLGVSRIDVGTFPRSLDPSVGGSFVLFFRSPATDTLLPLHSTTHTHTQASSMSDEEERIEPRMPLKASGKGERGSGGGGGGGGANPAPAAPAPKAPAAPGDKAAKAAKAAAAAAPAPAAPAPAASGACGSREFVFRPIFLLIASFIRKDHNL